MASAQGTVTSWQGISTFLKTGMCSVTLCRVLDNGFAHPLELEEKASELLAGGILARGYQCGQVWGSALAAGAEAHRRLGAGPRAEAAAVVAAQRLAESFRARYGSCDCRSVTGVDFGDPSQIAPKVAARYFLKNGWRCFHMAGQFSVAAFGEIGSALSGDQGEAPEPPVSCAALTAQKMGAPELHAVMAAGFAGGIGLSGGACGALGAALWLLDMDDRRQGAEKIGYKSDKAKAVIERFAASTGSKFECRDIVGRRFESVADHAAFLRDGGCASLIELLAAERPPAAA